MNKLTFCFILLVFLSMVDPYAQDTDKLCSSWRVEMDKVTDLDAGVKYCQEKLIEVSPVCRTYVYLEIAGLFFRKLELNNALAYYDKAINNAKNLGADEALSYAYCSKITLLIRKEQHEEIYSLLKKSRELILPFPKSKSWIKYYEQNAYISYETADYYTAIDYMDSTIIAAKRSNYKTLIHETYEHLGYCYLKIGDYEKSAENFFKSLELKEQYGYLKDIGGTYRNLGGVYLEWKHFDKAKFFLEKSIAVTKSQNHQLSLMFNYHKLAQCYAALGLNDKAEKTIDSSTVLANKAEDGTYLILNFREKGLLYLNNYKNYQKAEKYLNKAYEYAKLSRDNKYIFHSIKDLIELYFIKEDYLKIDEYIKKLGLIEKNINTLKSKIYLLKTQARYYEKINEPKKALQKIKKYHTLQDSIMNKEVFEKVALLEKKYDTKKKELEISNLNKEKQKQIQILEKAQARQNLYLLASGVLLCLLFIGIWAFRKLRKQQRELSATNQVKNRLFSIIAHDLRGMLVPFQRSGKILKYHITNGNHKKTIELSGELEKNSERLSNTLDNLLNWSLEQMNGYKVHPEQIFVGEQLKEIISDYQEQASFKKTIMEINYEEEVSICFDKGAFHVIFRNLISNALKYTQEGTICIEFRNENNVLICTIVDTGLGMTEDQLQHLFTLEEKKNTIGTQGEKGTGLGLNLVYRFIKMHNGSIQVSSEKRIGTRFVLSIPILRLLHKEKGTSTTSLSA
ncbi:hypothetical protein GCM10022393_34990 [Aquimarina addita]|uniref:histidine kinase n=1 Tax=Aquimarina addita TaxID=870485 RepID=A0ABP6USS1_9FLAO